MMALIVFISGGIRLGGVLVLREGSVLNASTRVGSLAVVQPGRRLRALNKKRLSHTKQYVGSGCIQKARCEYSWRHAR
jgi:hypothetical protein